MPEPWLRSRLIVRLYLVVAALLLLGGVAGFARLWPSLGLPFGGFIWQYDNVLGHSVSYDVPRHWPGPRAGLEPHTTILAINGRSPWDFPAVYAQARVGELVAYDLVTPEGLRHTISAPVVQFTLRQLFEAYGLIFIAGITISAGGYILVRSARTTGRVLLAFIMLVGADSAFYHSHNGNIATFYNQPFFVSFMWAPSVAITGALLCHAALVYPRRRRFAERYSWLVPLCYAVGLPLGLLLGVALYFGANKQIAGFQQPLLFASFGYMVLGMVATLASGLWTWLRQRDELARAERRKIRIVAVAWLLAMLVLFGTVGAAVLRLPTLFEVLIGVGIVMPIGLVYAITNADLIEQLEDESALRGQLLAQLHEVHRLQDRLLSDLADELHDSALAESKGLEMQLYALAEQAARGHLDNLALRDQLARLHQHSLSLGQTLRQTVEGAKPVDFSSERFLDALERVIAHLNASGGSTTYILEQSTALDDCPLEHRHALFWIIRAALNNVRDHAQATCCRVQLWQTGQAVETRISDDGRGIDAAASTGELRRHLGIPAMRARAARLGGTVQVQSSGRGTQVRVRLPLPTAYSPDPGAALLPSGLSNRE